MDLVILFMDTRKIQKEVDEWHLIDLLQIHTDLGHHRVDLLVDGK